MIDRRAYTLRKAVCRSNCALVVEQAKRRVAVAREREAARGRIAI